MQSIADILENLRSADMLRSLKNSDIRGSKIEVDGVEFLNFASNDYLGLSADVGLQKEFLNCAASENKFFLMGSLSSRLLGGNNSAFARLEDFFNTAYNAGISQDNLKKSCLVFNCGYHANNGILPAIFGSRDLILCDKLVHASLIDSLKLGDAKWFRYAHNNLESLEELLQKHRKNFERVCIVTESVFSMDADRANLAALVELKKKYAASLYVDEAHAIGVFGECGLGLCEREGLIGEVDFIVGTLGKAAASSGAYVMCGKDERELLINRCRPFIFTTAIAPINLLWTEFIFEKILKMPARREKLKNLSDIFRSSIDGVPTLGDTQIVPVVLGSSKRASAISEKLAAEKIFAPIVRYPTVAKDSARIRFSLNADMSLSDLERTAAIFNALVKEIV